MAFTSVNKTYPSNKPSCIEWIGDIPDGWSVRKLKWCLLPGKAGMRIGPFGSSLKLDIMVDDGIKVYGQENVISSDYSPDTGKRRISYEKFKEMEAYEVFPDDILLSMMGSTGNFSRVPANVEKGIIDSHLLRIRFNELLNLDYFIYLSNYSAAVSQQVEAVGKGSIMQGLNSSLVRQLWLPLPPLPEQQAIASFLDRETARINKIIEKQTRLIELLKEKRSALITQAVTRGLNPNAKMKDSGVEWIGEIPEGWEVKKLKFICSVQTGDKDTVDSMTEGIYPLFVRSQIVERIDVYTHDCEAVLTAGDGVGVGKVFHYYNGPFSFHQRVYLFSNFKNITGKYLYYFLKENFYKVALEGRAKSTVDSLRMPLVLNFILSLPPLPEQQAIVDFIDRETVKIDTLISKIEKQIDLLNEYKQSLITAAVTGKIDVRNVQ